MHDVHQLLEGGLTKLASKYKYRTAAMMNWSVHKIITQRSINQSMSRIKRRNL